uniref:Uncharacterized protein n=1 Tax=Meloidogyne enterolobii TaxID=390850 RepID=A0A6V7TT15_MELEN|nr:unnamed protein product [Meloidogyne enterolobii]
MIINMIINSQNMCIFGDFACILPSLFLSTEKAAENIQSRRVTLKKMYLES